MPDQKTIIWDWNGTLLDDAVICLDAINTMLDARDLQQLSLEKYRDVFTFPVIEYYKKVGFDFSVEEWDPVAMEFIKKYLSSLPTCGLTPQAHETLRNFKHKGYKQAIISAMQHDELIKSVAALSIDSYFDYIGGIGDHYAHSKTENARDFFVALKLDPANVTLIGDTIHDSEVAAELGCQCILVATGHQSIQRLMEAKVPVINDLNEIKLYL